MYDSQFNYCPRCNGEYVVEISLCGICNEELVSGNEMLEREEARNHRKSDRSMELSREDNLVPIQKASLNELKRMQSLLIEERIGATIVGDDNSCGKGCCPSLHYLLIREEDISDAVEVIERDYRKTTVLEEYDARFNDSVFDPDNEEVVCPACGHSFPTSNSTCPDCGLCFS